MGGLGRYLPYTTGVMWIGALALAGVPPFSGFFSKDQILADALARGDWVGYTVWGLGLLGAFVTALYTFRLMLLVFHGAAERVRAPRTARRTPATARGRSRCSGRSACWRSARSSPACSRSRRSRTACATSSSPRSRPASRRPARRSSAPRRWRSRSRSSGCSPPTCCGARRSETPRRIAASTAPLERVLQEKFGFDRLYDWAFYRPAAALARGGAAAVGGAASSLGSMNVVGAAGSWTSRLLSTRAVRPRARVRARHRGRHRRARRLADHGRRMSGTWTSHAALAAAARRRARRAHPAAARRRARGARAARRRSSRRSSRSPRRSSSTPRGGDAVRAVARLGARHRADLPRRHGRPLARARGAHGRRACPARSASGSGPGAPTCAPTRR